MQADTVRVHSDPDRGHIAITSGGEVVTTLCDMGPVLNVWTYRTTSLTPPDARTLAAALIAWADRNHCDTTRDDDEALTELITWAAA